MLTNRPRYRGSHYGPEATRPFRETLIVWGGEFGRTPMMKTT